MPTLVNAWIDSQGTLHCTEQLAVAADVAHARASARLGACQTIEAAQTYSDDAGFSIFDFDGLERLNHDTLQPLADYIAILISESKERTEKYG